MTAAPISRTRSRISFLCCGAFGFGLYSILSVLLVRMPGVEVELAALLAVLLSIPPTFLLQRSIAFRDRGNALHSFARYCLLQAFNALAIAGLAAIGRRIGLPDTANLVASGAVVGAISYGALSRSVFRAQDRQG